MFIWILGAAVVVGLGYIRLAPSDPNDWHVPLSITQDQDLEGGVERVRSDVTRDMLVALDQVILATPRTQRLAGGAEGGHVTYVTRSKLFGFPDYTTFELRDGTLMVFGRLRFGRSDLGVNRKRVDGWLSGIEG
ncbi:MAG: DUF1499 domain-containing protein [Marinibacterium sp.]|nr:DUF1499 domain-containing protein [Marinibacterium sp.]